MAEMIWINGEVMELSEARVGVEDRGFQFADGVYEVIRIYGGRPFTLGDHLDRLSRSAAGIRLELPEVYQPAALAGEIERLIGRSGIAEGMVYVQATRGRCPRDHRFPSPPSVCPPTVLFYVRALEALPPPGRGPGVKLHSAADDRWKRCWIKSVALLANVLAKNAALAAGADEAVFIDEGMVTECSASNIYAVTGGQVVTCPVGAKVLGGITRQVLADLAAELGIEWVERPLPEREARMADELFITSTTREVAWVSHWDGRPVGLRSPAEPAQLPRCGPTTLRLHQALAQRIHGRSATLQ